MIPLSGIQQSRRMGHAVPAHWKSMRQICEENKAHMNYLPVPEGSWQEAYNKQNAKYNQLLALSVVTFVVTAVAVSMLLSSSYMCASFPSVPLRHYFSSQQCVMCGWHFSMNLSQTSCTFCLWSEIIEKFRIPVVASSALHPLSK